MRSQMYTLVLLLATCAIAFANEEVSLRILGGQRASIKDHPYLVSIRINGRHHCGGAIITDQHILTACHCIQGHIAKPYSDISVISGSDSLFSGGEAHTIRGAYCHGLYTAANIKNDIGILSLARKMTFSDTQKSIALPSSNFAEQTRAVIAGFGSTQTNAESSPVLQALETQIVHIQGCAAFNILGATPGQICGMQVPGKGTCQGDSGSPLVANDQVVGIVSHGTDIVSKQCGITPDIYTDVFFYIPFIKDIIVNY